MHGVMKNIAHLCNVKNSTMWGPDGWKKVVVCIVSDGRKVVNKKVLDVLATMGVYQDGLAKSIVDNKPVKAHVYEVKHIHLHTFFAGLTIVFVLVHCANFRRFEHVYQRLRQGTFFLLTSHQKKKKKLKIVHFRALYQSSLCFV